MVIDSFTLFGSWPGLPYDHQVEELVSGLERFRVDRACTLSSKGIFFDAAAGNQTTWNVCQQDQRLLPIGVADPRIDGVEQVNYCKTQGFPLLALFPTAQEWSLSGIMAKTVLQRIAEVNLPVMIEAGRPEDAAGILAATRDLEMPVILLGVSLPVLTDTLALMRERPNIYLSTRLLCGGDTIDMLVTAIGAERLLFGSRFPISCFSSAFLTAKFANIDDAARAAIMGGNMARILGLS